MAALLVPFKQKSINLQNREQEREMGNKKKSSVNDVQVLLDGGPS